MSRPVPASIVALWRAVPHHGPIADHMEARPAGAEDFLRGVVEQSERNALGYPGAPDVLACAAAVAVSRAWLTEGSEPASLEGELAARACAACAAAVAPGVTLCPACARLVAGALRCHCTGCPGCLAHAAAARALLPTDLTVCDLPEVLAARPPVAGAELAEVPVAWLRPAPAPAPLPKLLAACTALALGRFGAWAKLGTFDAFTWQVVCVDPCDPGVVLADHPSAVGPTPEAAAVAFCDALHELNVADAVAADERAAEVLAHRVAHPELEAPEPSPLPGDDDGRFDARPRSLADVYPGLPFAFTVTPDGEVLDTATGAPLGPEAAAAVRAEVA